MAKIQVHFDGKVLVPVDRVDLPVGKLLDAEVTESPELAIGSPALILKTMNSLPHIPREDIDELNRLIEEGSQPASYEGIFDVEDDTK